MNKKNIILLTVVSLLTLLAGLLVVSLRDKSSQEVSDLINLNQADLRLSNNGLQAKEKLISRSENGVNVVLTDQFMEIGYMPEPADRFVVFILGNEVEKIEENALGWFRSKGFSEEDICALPVVFSIVAPNPQVDADYKLEMNYLPEFCREFIN